MKKIIFTSAAVFLIINSLSSQSGWFPVYSEDSTGLNSVIFPDVNTGYSVGNQKYIPLLLKTTNAGGNWFEISTSYSYWEYSFINAYFLNQYTGFISVVYSGDGPPMGFIIRTTNGGNDWYPPNQGVEGAFINSFVFVNSYTGYAVGSPGYGWYGSTGSKYKTIDGGDNWSRIDITGDEGCSYSSVYFLDLSTGFLARHYRGSLFSPNVLKTTDGGANWIELLPNNWSKLLRSVCFLDENTGFGCGNGIILTSNGGINWNIAINGSQYNKIKFISYSNGYCIGYNQILKTTNGGFNWHNQTSSENTNYSDCFFTNINTGYVLSNELQKGSILKTTTGGENFVGNGLISNRIPSGFRLFQNYPNPFNPYTRIKFELPLKPEMANVKLEIYDNLGRIVSTLVSEQLKPGSYEAEWDASQYTSGIYFYRLTAGELSETKKMILIK